MAEPDGSAGAEDPPSGPSPTSTTDEVDPTDAPARSEERLPASPSAQAPRDAGQRKGKPEERRGALAFLRELPVLLLVAFLLALLIKTFLVQAFYIPSESMESTLNVGDRVLVNKVSYHLHDIHRGDIIVFSDPHPVPQPHRNPVSGFFHWLTEGLGVSTSPDKDFIKRVIGLPGEEVEIKRGVVYINGTALDEPYITAEAREGTGPYGPITVPADSLFVMGDNRTNSNDSRFGLGFIPIDKVIGRAFVIIWPPSRVGLLHGL